MAHLLHQIKSNHFLSHHHSTSALVSEILMSVLQTVQKQQTIYLWTDSAKKQHNRQFTYGHAHKKQNTAVQHAKNCTGAFTVLQTVQKTTTAIYIWTDSAKKQQQFTYGQYIFTDCTEDNVQNTHTYTQYT